MPVMPTAFELSDTVQVMLAGTAAACVSV